MSSLIFYCPQVSILFSFLAVIAFFVNALRTNRRRDRRTDGPMDGWTDGLMDRRRDGLTDKTSYRDVWTHIKIQNKIEAQEIDSW